MIIKKNQKLGLRRAKTHKYYILTDWRNSTALDNIRSIYGALMVLHTIGQPKRDTLQHRKIKVKAQNNGGVMF